MEQMFLTNNENGEIKHYKNNDIIRYFMNEYPTYKIFFIPKNFDVVLILIEEFLKDSSKDKWRAIFFKTFLEKTSSGNVTLDNLDDNIVLNKKIECYKHIDGNFQEIISICCELIDKHSI